MTEKNFVNLDQYGRYTTTNSNTTDLTPSENINKSIPKEILQANWLTSVLVITLEFVMMALSVVIAEKSPIFPWLATFLAVMFIGNRMFVVGEELLHEASHFKLFASRKLNIQVGDYVLGLPFLNEFHSYHLEHWKHHKNVLAEEDALSFDYQNWGLYDQNKSFFYIYFVQPLIGFIQIDFTKRVFSQMLNNRIFCIKVAGYYSVLFALSIYFGMLAKFMLYWVFPLFWIHPIFLFWSEVEDHYNTKTGNRTNLSYNPFLYPYNSGYHYAHHLFPYVPWYSLPQVHYSLCKGKSDETNGFFDTYFQMANFKKDQ